VLAQDREDTIARYRRRYAAFGYDPRTLGWNKGRQAVRFAAALEGIGLGFQSILDVGCGFGDLFGFLSRQGWQGSYLGVDVVPELIEEGRRRYGPSGARFECRDITAEGRDETAEVGVAIGLFNHKLRGQNVTFIQETLSALWRHTSVALVADFLSATADRPREDLYYAEPAELIRLAQRWSRRVVLHHGYMPFEFNIKIWHDDSFSVEAPVFEDYRKYIMPAEAPPTAA
jgi:SAM-dependent methyltransferase